MASPKRSAWTYAILATVLGAALALPFLLHRTQVFYTDGGKLRAPENEAGASVRDVLWETPDWVAGEVNRPDEDEYEPRVSPDGDLLAFTRGRPGGGAELWLAERERGRWARARPFEEVNSPADDLGACFAPEGMALLFYSNREGGQGGYDLWLSRRGDEGWGPAENLGPVVNSPWNEIGPALTPDGRTIYFSSDRRKEPGSAPPWKGTLREARRIVDYDIYSAVYSADSTGTLPPGGSFGEPAPLSALNLTGSSEGTVAVSPSGDFLYFSSNRPGGAGGFDLYRARIKPVLLGAEPLGPQVNSPLDDLDPALGAEGFQLYFSRGREGQEDILASASREVYREREVGEPYLSLAPFLRLIRSLSDIPPLVLWIILALIAAAIVIFLVRRKLLTVNLLARCFLIALLVHLLIVLWMYRTEVEDLVVQAFPGPGDGSAGDGSDGAAFGSGEGLMGLEGGAEENVGLAIREAVAKIPGEEGIPSPGRGPRLFEPGDSPTALERPLLAPEGDPPGAPSPGPEPPREPPPGALVLGDELPAVPGPSPPLDLPEVVSAPLLSSPGRDMREEAPPLLPSGTSTGFPDREGPAAAPSLLEGAPLAKLSPTLFPAATSPDAVPRGGVEPQAPAPDDPQPFREPGPLESAPSGPLEGALAGLAMAGADALPDPQIEGGLPGAGLLPPPEEPRTEPAALSGRSGPRGSGTERVGGGGSGLARGLARAAPAKARLPAGGLPGSGAPGPRPAPIGSSGLQGSTEGAVIPLIGPSLLGTEPADPPAPALGARSSRGSPPPSAIGGASRESGEGRGLGGIAGRAAPVAPAGGGPISGIRTAAAPTGAIGPTGAGTAGSVAKAGTIDLAGSLRPLTFDEGSGGQGRDSLPSGLPSNLSPKEGGQGYLPKLYQSREKSQRAEALRAGGGSTRTERAVERGLGWLALHQSPDGRWSLRDYAAHVPEVSPRDLFHSDWSGRGRNDSRGGSGNARNGDAGATGLALLSFLGHGDTHLQAGAYRETVARGLEWLRKAQRQNGDLRAGGNLYMHAIASFALCEAYAFTRDPALREPAERAIRFTVRSQNPDRGGWRYEPYPLSEDVDTSVFGWMLMALKSARLGGLEVDQKCLELASDYLDSARMTPTGGRYAYQPGRSRTSLAMTAQGFFSSQMLADTLPPRSDGERQSLRRAAGESLEHILSNLPRAADQDGANEYYWYYASLALFQEGGEPWEVWNKTLTELLLRLQVGETHGTASGSWDPLSRRAGMGGRVYSTAMSILCLEVYYRYGRVKQG